MFCKMSPYILIPGNEYIIFLEVRSDDKAKHVVGSCYRIKCALKKSLSLSTSGLGKVEVSKTAESFAQENVAMNNFLGKQFSCF